MTENKNEDFSEALEHKVKCKKAKITGDKKLTKIGGIPDVPSNFVWPMWQDKPQSFLAQIDLSEVKDDLLPNEGMLYFFYDQSGYTWGFHDEKDSWQVIYIKDVNNEELQPMVHEALENEFIYKETFVDYIESDSFPPWESDIIENLNLSWDAIDRYIEYTCGDEYITKLLGYPDQIQGDLTVETHLNCHNLSYEFLNDLDDVEQNKFKKEKDEWQLLFQLDSDYKNNKMMWGDCGRLYFMIKKSDLKQCNFDNVWMILQCC